LGVKQVSYYLWKEYERSYFARFIQVDFSFLIAFLLEKTTPKFRSVLLKRYMLKTTHILNEYLEQKYSFFKKPYQAVVK
jgi:thiamine biosynthesis protein ThiI